MEYVKIVDYLRQCPQLAKILPVGGKQDDYVEIVMPNGGSDTAQTSGKIDSLGNFDGGVYPKVVVYNDYQINCYRYYDVNDNNPPQYNENALTLDEIGEIYKWVAEQDEKENFPDVDEKVVSVECSATQTRIQGVNSSENLVCYPINFRVWYVNNIRKLRNVYYEL